jgi:CBS domain-containing protein
MSGEEVLPKIKKMNPDIQVIMLTGHGEAESARKSLQQDAFDYLNKPCDIDILSAKIKEAFFLRSGKHHTERTVGEIMVPIEDYATIDVNATIKEGIAKLKESFESFQSTEQIKMSGHRVLIVFDGKEPVGILNMHNMMEAVRPDYLSDPKPSMMPFSIKFSHLFWQGLFTHQVENAESKLVKDYMNSRPPVIDKNGNLMEAVNLMCEENRRRVVVTDQGRVVGVVREQEIFYEITRTMFER